ncbi:unnamed protein product [Vitrella brassicaformis CCMP3155]|uniref:Uncharacterized protein n=2 Tax=Vitrella brassicaformis TaxID=1169539 RepID=A0A0G4FTU4_VITBC|nr:unnamed protein product [Vitrella brassicaformis CCMP3155]|eukprot:CEM18371.1 unnamed protein product [Vitrella brassicaformis CCMP3155]
MKLLGALLLVLVAVSHLFAVCESLRLRRIRIKVKLNKDKMEKRLKELGKALCIQSCVKTLGKEREPWCRFVCNFVEDVDITEEECEDDTKGKKK